MTEFDIILGNPPYQYPKGNAPISKGKSLYLDFIESGSKILKEGGELIFIGPANYLKPTDYRNKTRNFKQLEGLDIIEIETGIEKKFDVQIETFISLLHCKKSKQVSKSFIVDGEEWDINEIPFIFARGNKELRSIGKKIWKRITDPKVGTRMRFIRIGAEKVNEYGIGTPMCSRVFHRADGVIKWTSDRSNMGNMNQILNLDLNSDQINRLFLCKAFVIITHLTNFEPTLYHNLLNGIVLPDKLNLSEEITDEEIMKSYGFCKELIEEIKNITEL